MKVLALNTFDAGGGAARAAVRLSQSLNDIGVDVRLRVLRKTTDLPWVDAESGVKGKLQGLARPLLDALSLRCYRQRSNQPWSTDWLPYPAIDRAVANADLVHLHWTGFGYFSPSQLLRWHKPVVWTLHDMWPVTGGCHYAGGCSGLSRGCGMCPQLGSQRASDLSSRQFARKHAVATQAHVTFVSPSRWMADQARASGVLGEQSVHVIANGLDLNRFQPLDVALARQAFQLPVDRPVILFGALNALEDERKGSHLLLEAIRYLEAEGWPAEAQPIYVVFGASAPGNEALAGFPIRYLGRLHDDVTLALLYSAADVMVVPSLQETFGQTASEAMACGTPVVAFAATGLLDVVTHGETGYLARPYEASDLAAGIRWILSDSSRLRALSLCAREYCEQHFDQREIARAHQALYETIVAEHLSRTACNI